MPRTEYDDNSGYNSIDANAQFDEYSVAKKQLSGLMKVDKYTGGALSGAANAVSQDAVNRVRRDQ